MERTKQLGVIGADTIARMITQDMNGVLSRVREAYTALDAGVAVNPPSLFLRPPERPNSRIIALPAHMGRPHLVSGIKWISSYPDNARRNLPRASAVLILNDGETGYPYACLEGAAISAARTAASALLAAEALCGPSKRVGTVGVVGNGVISRTFVRFLLGSGWQVRELVIYDTNSGAQAAFREWLGSEFPQVSAQEAASADAALARSELAFFATLAAQPHVHSLQSIEHAPVILHISLRDLAPEIILAAHNVVDDPKHVLNAGTSVLLAAEVAGHTRFIDCTLAQLMAGHHTLPAGRARVFSPFGLGVLDLAVGAWLYERAAAADEVQWIDDFFGSREVRGRVG